MSWIQTFTGRKVYPLALKPSDVCVEDIAHALSMKCRFNGHCREFYSVAEHSTRVAMILPKGKQVFGLLHDAAEAYLPDVCAPIKSAVYVANTKVKDQFNAIAPAGIGCAVLDERQGELQSFSYAEQKAIEAIAEAFFLDPHGFEAAAVRQADMMLLATEARDLLAEPPEPWGIDSPVMQERITPLGPSEAEAAFLTMFNELTAAPAKGAA